MTGIPQRILEWQVSTLRRCSKSVVTGEIQIETMRYHYTPIRMTKTIPKACKDAEQMKLSYVASENKNDTAILEEKFGSFL